MAIPPRTAAQIMIFNHIDMTIPQVMSTNITKPPIGQPIHRV
jgi:hypothetical protein